jgi:hypothetical protein
MTRIAVEQLLSPVGALALPVLIGVRAVADGRTAEEAIELVRLARRETRIWILLGALRRLPGSVAVVQDVDERLACSAEIHLAGHATGFVARSSDLTGLIPVGVPVRRAMQYSPMGEAENLEALRNVLDRYDSFNRLGALAGEGGERAFRGWLISGFLQTALGWPWDRLVLGESLDVLALDWRDLPMIYIETKAPDQGSPASARGLLG